MAIKATIYKAELSIADMDRGYYADHSLTLARHPSETDERLMVRLLAFALHAHERLVSGKGLCVDDEPDLWRKSLGGVIELWIDVGLPDPKWIRKACNRSEQVLVVNYGSRAADIWWAQNREFLSRLGNLSVIALSAEDSKGLADMASRNMRLQCNIQDGQAWLDDGQRSAHIEPLTLQRPAAH